MFRFIRKVFVVAMSLFDCNALKCVSLNNQESKGRPEIICSGSCNIINDKYAKLCVLDVSKNMNVKVFNLISITNKTSYIKRHETCKCKCRLDASVCNNKQRWSEDKCQCECKELIDKGVCDKTFIWNSSNCECECDKSCDVGEYVDYTNCKCRKKLVDKLVEECRQNIDEKELHPNKMIY